MSVIGTIIANVVANNEQFNKGLVEAGGQYSAFLKHIEGEQKKLTAITKSSAVEVVDPIRESMKKAWKIDNSQRLNMGSKSFFEDQLGVKQLKESFNKLDFVKHAAGATQFTSVIGGVAGSLKGLGIAAGAGLGVATLVDMMVRGRSATAGFAQEIFSLADAITKTDNPFKRTKIKPFSVGTNEELKAAADAHFQEINRLNESSAERNEILFGKRADDGSLIDPATKAALDEDNSKANAIKAAARKEIFALVGDGTGKNIDNGKGDGGFVKPAANDDPRVIDAENRIKAANKRLAENIEAEAKAEKLAQDQFRGRVQFGAKFQNTIEGFAQPLAALNLNKKFTELNKFSEIAQADFAKAQQKEDLERQVDPKKKFDKQLEEISLQKSRFNLDDATVARMQVSAKKDFMSALGIDANRPQFASAVRADSSQAYNALLDRQSKENDPLKIELKTLQDINNQQLEQQKIIAESLAAKPQIAGP